MVLKAPFEGLMAPVFAPFDENFQIQLDAIPRYVDYLFKSKVKGILVNGTVGEGVSMSAKERMKVAEAWVESSRGKDISVMVQIGGGNLNDVVKLAKHAESLGVGSILCLPELFFKPESVRQLVDYLKIVSEAAPSTPLLYYHIPSFTKVHLDMEELLDVGYYEIETLAGIKYTDTDLEQAYRCLMAQNQSFAIYLGVDQLLSAAFAMGFDSAISVFLNFDPHSLQKMLSLVENGKIAEANAIQMKINNVVNYIRKDLKIGPGFKAAISMKSGLRLGHCRLPQQIPSSEKLTLLREFLESNGWISPSSHLASNERNY